MQVLLCRNMSDQNELTFTVAIELWDQSLRYIELLTRKSYWSQQNTRIAVFADSTIRFANSLSQTIASYICLQKEGGLPLVARACASFLHTIYKAKGKDPLLVRSYRGVTICQNSSKPPRNLLLFWKT